MLRLEHANLMVRDLEAMVRFVRTALPEFRIRGEGKTWQGGRWVHVGTDDAYLSLTQATEAPAEPWTPYGGKPGLNHLGFEVDDAEALRERMSSAGYRESTVPNSHPHRTRVYFYDAEGNDWEFVQYHSQEPGERNDYELADVG
jgi:catechol 2,3-dioxygenase-like lactoylglutathione lyase family enzyme